jgi:hypothetical protein
MFSKLKALVAGNLPELFVLFFVLMMPWVSYLSSFLVGAGAVAILIAQNVVGVIVSLIWLAVKRDWGR